MLMIIVIRLSLIAKEKSVELKLSNGLSTLHTNICSYTRSIALGMGPIQIWKTEIPQLFFQLLWCYCLFFLIFLMLLLTLNILYLLWMSLMLPSGISLWATNRCYIYWSSGKTLVGNCAKDWPNGVLFRDTCL